MGARGRKSSAELTLVKRTGDVLVVRRPDPPGNLSDDAAAEWREVVGSLPADYFSRAVYPLLEGYCTQAAEIRRIDARIQGWYETGEGSLGEYGRQLSLHDRAMRTISMLSVRLGLGSACNVTRVRTLTGKTADKPWERV